MEVCPYSYFWWGGYYQRSWVSFVTTDEFSVRVTKLLQRLVSHELTAYLHVFNLFLAEWIMTMLWKGSKPHNFEPQNSLKLWIFVECESFLESDSPDILALCETNLEWFNWFWQFLCDRLFSFSLKRFYYSYACSCSLCERRASFCTGRISRKILTVLLFWISFFWH